MFASSIASVLAAYGFVTRADGSMSWALALSYGDIALWCALLGITVTRLLLANGSIRLTGKRPPIPLRRIRFMALRLSN